MQYLLLIHIDESKAAEASAEDVAAVLAGVDAIDHELTADGRKLALARLDPSTSARTVRSAGGKRTVTDGPFVDTKEQLAGFWVVEASDIDEALEVAKRLPITDYAAVEVWPIAAIDLPRSLSTWQAHEAAARS